MEAGLLDQSVAAMDDDLGKGRGQPSSARGLAQPLLVRWQLRSSGVLGLGPLGPLGAPMGLWYNDPVPPSPSHRLYQDVEQHVEVVGDPEGLEADTSEVVGGEHVHDGQDDEQQHSCHACERGWEVLAGIWDPSWGSPGAGQRTACHPHLEWTGRPTSNTSEGAVT